MGQAKYEGFISFFTIAVNLIFTKVAKNKQDTQASLLMLVKDKMGECRVPHISYFLVTTPPFCAFLFLSNLYINFALVNKQQTVN